MHKIIRHEISLLTGLDDLALNIRDDLGLFVFFKIFICIGEIYVYFIEFFYFFLRKITIFFTFKK